MRSITALLPSWSQPIARWLMRLLLPATLALTGAAALAAAPRDRLTLLVPDNAAPMSWQVKVWTDSAAEEGIVLETLTDSQFLALGTTAATKIAGLVVPDSAHINASNAVVAAIKQYAFTGGKVMLVYDAGALDETGFYPLDPLDRALTLPSRFSDMVGVNYVLFQTLGAANLVGFGQVVGTQARLESLSLPPGKYAPYVAPASLTRFTTTTAFVQTSRLDPGGSQLMAAKVAERGAKGIDDGSNSVRRMRLRSMRDALGLNTQVDFPVRYAHRVEAASKARDQHVKDKVDWSDDDIDAEVAGENAKETGKNKNKNKSKDKDNGGGSTSTSTSATNAADTALQAISGYAFGPLGYFHYVTTGTFPGTVYLSSPEHGLVAGLRPYGSGQVLFVNLPLGYFKAVGTDSAPLHGFLNLFARDQVGISSLSVQPRGVGGLVYNWHVDAGDDLTADAKFLLDNTTVLKRGPFSIHFTAGPGVVTFTDGQGINLPLPGVNMPGNPAAQALVRRLGNFGEYAGNLPVQHELGSHGGWIHDYWGATATEANVPDLTNLLQWNFDAIERAAPGLRIREYSSPQGNTPLWALKWMEARGVKAAYTVGDGGAATVRSWRLDPRDGLVKRVADKLWSVPVTPLVKYATFEEFEEFGISDAVSGQWLLDLQSFAVNHRTNRMFYNHPPGARGHLAAINPLLSRADTLQAAGRFRWYTMTELAEFSQRRVETSWSTSSANGVTTFVASHPTSLVDMTWLLPKSGFTSPAIVSGDASVTGDSKYWIVTVNKGARLTFKANE